MKTEKNKLIGVPILSELSKVRELVKTENLKQKLSDWDEEFKDLIENNKILELRELLEEYHIIDIFDIMENLETNEKIKFTSATPLIL